MHLSAQEEYGLRCLLQVAQQAGDRPAGIPKISAAEGLSPEYTAKLMRLLRQGGLVESTRGPGGGYRLSRGAAEITAWQALEVLGGPLFSEEFCDAHPGQLDDCVHSGGCSVRSLWRWIGGAVRTALESVTLRDLTRSEDALASSLSLVQLSGARAGFPKGGAERPR